MSDPNQRCNCGLGFRLCALMDNARCARWAQFPDTPEGRAAAVADEAWRNWRRRHPAAPAPCSSLYIDEDGFKRNPVYERLLERIRSHEIEKSEVSRELRLWLVGYRRRKARWRRKATAA